MGRITKLLVLTIGFLLIFGGMYVYSLSKIEVRSININNTSKVEVRPVDINNTSKVEVRPVNINNTGDISPGMSASPTIQQISPTTALSKKPIYFELNPGNPTSCGATCRQTTATLTNTGDDTAHNVKINLNIYNNVGDSVYSTQESLGDIPGGKSRSNAVTINADCGSILSLYSKCRDHMPLTLKTDIIFDEGTQNFPDQQFGG
jgi:hypothetical protein